MVLESSQAPLEGGASPAVVGPEAALFLAAGIFRPAGGAAAVAADMRRVERQSARVEEDLAAVRAAARGKLRDAAALAAGVEAEAEYDASRMQLNPQSPAVVPGTTSAEKYAVLDTSAEERKPPGTKYVKRPQVVKLPPGIAYELRPVDVEFTVLKSELGEKTVRKPEPGEKVPRKP